MEILALILLCIAPAAAFAVFLHAPSWIDHAVDSLRQRRARRMPTSPPIERLAADLRRISAEIERIQVIDPPYKVVRLKAAVAAYDDTLLVCCRSLGGEPPRDRGPLDPRERLDAEVALLQEGLTW